MKLKSRLLGEMEIDENQMIHFPGGIPGFEEETRFAFFPMAENTPFYLMQSANNPYLCLVLAVPFTFFPDYQVDIDDDLLEPIAISPEDPDLVVFSILTIPSDFKEATANLLAPIVINVKQKKGMQVVPFKTRYTTKHRIFPPA